MDMTISILNFHSKSLLVTLQTLQHFPWNLGKSCAYKHIYNYWWQVNMREKLKQKEVTATWVSEENKLNKTVETGTKRNQVMLFGDRLSAYEGWQTKDGGRII